jgi:hypothetical protein
VFEESRRTAVCLEMDGAAVDTCCNYEAPIVWSFCYLAPFDVDVYLEIYTPQDI